MQAGFSGVHDVPKPSQAKFPSPRWNKHHFFTLSSSPAVSLLDGSRMWQVDGIPFVTLAATHTRSHWPLFWVENRRCWVESCGVTMVFGGSKIFLPKHSWRPVPEPQTTGDFVWSLSPASLGWRRAAPSMGSSDFIEKAELGRKTLSGGEHLAGILLPGQRL